jgi:hypothetical protein
MRFRPRCLAFCAAAVWLCLTNGFVTAADFTVAVDGNDSHPGTREKPFASLGRARDAIRAARQGGSLAAEPVTVTLRGGTHFLSQPFILGAEDSGTPDHPVVYRAADGERAIINGGRPVDRFRPVTDAAVLAKLDSAARPHIVAASLKDAGIDDLQGVTGAGFCVSDPGLEFFVDNRPMTLARYPNKGYMHVTGVVGADDAAVRKGAALSAGGVFLGDDPRPVRWAAEKGVILQGFWMWDWGCMRVPMAGVDADAKGIVVGPIPGGTMKLRHGQWFYAQNILLELDSPGEWYLDRDTGILYCWPPVPLSAGRAVVSVVRDPVQLDGVSNVSFRGLVLECGRGAGLVIRGGENVRVEACTVRNTGGWGVQVRGGVRHAVVGCDIHETGQGGIILDGGDRRTLVPAGHVAHNNHIHHTARWDPLYQEAIKITGVGNRTTNNLIHHVPHVAIGFTGNDHAIEYNEIHSSVFQANDAGAIYTGVIGSTGPANESWSMRGHTIRFNYLHDLHGFQGKGSQGVYLDDCFSSAEISGNVFYNITSADISGTILIGGGRDNLMTNNIFLKCTRAVAIDARGLGWAKDVGEPATRELIELDHKHPPWSLRYPQLVGILEDTPLAPKGNVVARNVCWEGKWEVTQPSAKPFITFENNVTEGDPHFLGHPPADFRLAADSPALDLGFQQIPFDRIGLRIDEHRKSLPADGGTSHHP